MDTQNQDLASLDRLVAPAEAPKIYTELAPWWPLLSPPGDYAEEAAFYLKALVDACEMPPHTLLELGSDGGNNASYLKSRFQMVLVDLSPGMLAVSRRLNPECEHVEGDTRTVRLGRQFDCVLVHDAIVYMTTEADLRKAIETAFVHCRPGGAALFAPDHIKETFRPSTDSGGHDGERESLRYLEWTWDPDPTDATYVVDYAFLLRGSDGSVRVIHDRHTEGLFCRTDWLRLLSQAEVPAERRAVRAFGTRVGHMRDLHRQEAEQRLVYRRLGCLMLGCRRRRGAHVFSTTGIMASLSRLNPIRSASSMMNICHTVSVRGRRPAMDVVEIPRQAL